MINCTYIPCSQSIENCLAPPSFEKTQVGHFKKKRFLRPEKTKSFHETKRKHIHTLKLASDCKIVILPSSGCYSQRGKKKNYEILGLSESIL